MKEKKAELDKLEDQIKKLREEELKLERTRQDLINQKRQI